MTVFKNFLLKQDMNLSAKSLQDLNYILYHENRSIDPLYPEVIAEEGINLN